MIEKKNSRQLYISLFYLGLIAALEVFFFRSLLSADALPGDHSDACLNNLIMEHWFHFFRGKEPFDTLSQFYPVKDTVSYTDMLLGYAPLYSLLRFAGLSLFQAGKFTVVLIHAAGSFALFSFLKKHLKTGNYAAFLGVLCFSFANGYAVRFRHTQMIAVSLIPLILIFLAKAYENRDAGKKRWFWLWLAVSFYALLAYTGWYSFFFLSLFLLICALSVIAVCAFLSRNLLKKLGWGILGHFREILLFTGYLVCCLIPFLMLYLPTSRMAGRRSWQEVAYFLPRPSDLINVGKNNLLLGRFFPALAEMSAEQKGVWELIQGFVPAALLLLVLLLVWFFLHESGKREDERRKNRGRQISDEQDIRICAVGALAAAIFFSILLVMDLGGYSLWWLVWKLVPGAGAIRAAARWYFFLLLPMAVLLAYLTGRLLKAVWDRNFWPGQLPGAGVLAAMAACAVFLWIANINTASLSGWKESEQRAFLESVAAPPQEAEVIALGNTSGYVNPEPYTDQLRAWMLADHYGLKTVNGYSGQVPEYFTMQDITAFDYVQRILQYRADTDCEEDVYIYDLGNGSWSLAATGPVSWDTEYSFSTAEWAFFSGDWHECEPWGRWAGADAGISFTAPEEAECTLVLTMQAFFQERNAVFRLNGYDLGSCTIGTQADRYKFKVPAGVLQVYNKLSYSLEGEPVRPAEAEAGNQDKREIGVGFVSMKLKR